MPAEQLRGARIMLLKITHLPYVAAIWLFEGTRGRLVQNGNKRHPKRNGWQSVLQRQNLAKLGNESGFSHLTATPPASKNIFEELHGPPRMPDGVTPSGRNGDQKMKQAIDKLSAQIEELTKQLSKTGERSHTK